MMHPTHWIAITKPSHQPSLHLLNFLALASGNVLSKGLDRLMLHQILTSSPP
jgi:hypothetical protein